MKGKRKPVICVETGVIYESSTQAGKLAKTDRVSVSKSAQSDGKISAGSRYHWKYV